MQTVLIFEPWDGNAEMLGSDIGVSGVTVRQWRNRDSIPPKYWQKIVAAARARGKVLLLEWFVPEDDANLMAPADSAADTITPGCKRAPLTTPPVTVAEDGLALSRRVA